MSNETPEVEETKEASAVEGGAVNETQEKKKFEIDAAKAKELRQMAYKFIDKIKIMGGEKFKNSEGFDGKDSGDVDFSSYYRQEGDEGVILGMKEVMDRAKTNPAYKGTIFEKGERNEELAKAIFKEVAGEIKQEKEDTKKISIGNLKKSIFGGK